MFQRTGLASLGPPLNTALYVINAPPMTYDALVALLGCAERSPQIVHLIAELGIKPTIEHFEGGKTYFGFPSEGIALVFNDGRLSSVQLFAAGTEEQMKAYAGTLPEDLSFEETRAAVLKKLGKPRAQDLGGAAYEGFQIDPWVKYEMGAYDLHLQFSADGSKVRLVSLQGPKK